MFKPRHESKAISLQAIARVMFKPFLFSLIQGDLPLLFGVSRVCSSPFINPKQKKRSPSYQAKSYVQAFSSGNLPIPQPQKKRSERCSSLNWLQPSHRKREGRSRKANNDFFFFHRSHRNVSRQVWQNFHGYTLPRQEWKSRFHNATETDLSFPFFNDQ